jgi:hypothetical protein
MEIYMNLLNSVMVMGGLLFCTSVFAEAEPAKDQEAKLRVLCQQIVHDVDEQMGQAVAACIPSASVQNGQPDLLMLVSKTHFSDEETRAVWIGLSIFMTARDLGKLPADSAPNLKAVMVDQANKERKSLEDLTLCTVPMMEAATLLQSVKDGKFSNFAEVYKNSRCATPAVAKQTEPVKK